MKLFRFDLKYGSVNPRTLVCALTLLSLCLLTCVELNSSHKSFDEGLPLLSAGDYLFYFFRGMKEYMPNPFEPFQFPSLWVLCFMIMLYTTLYHLHSDLMGIGIHTVIRTRGRTLWWLSKCFWNFSIITIFLCIVLASITAYAYFSKASMQLSVSGSMEVLIEMDANAIIPEEGLNMPLNLLLLPYLFALFLSQLQMTLTLFLKPIFSYTVSAVILISSSYYQSPFLPGNYAMTMRSSLLIPNGVSPTVGIAAFLILLIFITVLGAFLFKRHNILEREDCR